MASTQALARRLKELRGTLTVKELAKLTNVSEPALYRAETGTERVAWKTVEPAYGGLCRSLEEYCTLLALWAISHSRRTVSEPEMIAATSAVVRENHGDEERELRGIRMALERMSPEERGLFAKFAGIYCQDPATRALARLWLERGGADDEPAQDEPAPAPPQKPVRYPEGGRKKGESC